MLDVNSSILFKEVTIYFIFEVKQPCVCLLQLFAKLQAVKAEIHDIQEAHIKDRQELEQTQNELTRDLKLK